MSDQTTCPACGRAIAPADSTPDVAPDGSRRATTFGSNRRDRRRRFTGKGLALRALAGLLLAALVGATVLAVYPRSEIVVKPDRSRSHLAPRDEPPAIDVGSRKAHLAERDGYIDRSLAERLAELEAGVVRIESDAPGDRGAVGTGFLVGEGLVATCFHVLAGAARARARFKDGAEYDVVGYVAVRPEWDLAVVRLRDVPAGLPPLTLRTNGDPAPLADVLAVGHPRSGPFASFDGKVSRVLPTSELAPSSRQFLREVTPDEAELRWIRHTAKISAGYSGGPLFDAAGAVLGINAWVDRADHFAYALHADHLAALLTELLPEPLPLERFARRDARVAAMLRRLSASRIDQLLADAKALDWLPATEADYEKFQELAWAVTFANQPDTLAGRSQRGGLEAGQLDELVRATDRVVLQLQRQKWSGVGQITIVNDFAAQSVGRPMAGVFCIATVERVVRGDGAQRGVLLKLAGIDAEIFVPLSDQLLSPVPGQSCLVLGVNYEGQVVRYGDNPLKLHVVPVVVSRTILPLG